MVLEIIFVGLLDCLTIQYIIYIYIYIIYIYNTYIYIYIYIILAKKTL